MNYQPVFFDIETTGIHPTAMRHYGARHDAQVLSVGVGVFKEGYRGHDPEKDIFTITEGKNEYGLLRELREEMITLLSNIEGWNDIEDRTPQGVECYLVGYNSRNFDHQWLGARYSRFRQDPFPFTHSRKRLDLGRVVKKKAGHYMSQDDALEQYAGRTTDDLFDGSDVPDFFANGEMDKIESHCRSDIEDLMDIFLALKDDAEEEFHDHYDLGSPSAGEVELDE